MLIHKNFSLKKLNTFGFESKAAAFTKITSAEQLVETLHATSPINARNTTETLHATSLPQKPIYILGGGSNVLFTKDFYDALFLKNEIRGIKIIDETHNGNVIVEIGGGESWHTFVLWAIENNLGSVENLSLIPGTVGAAPIQNIGAYGIELKDVFVKLEAVNLNTFEIKIFTPEDCKFGYRDSVFKNRKSASHTPYFITKVYLQLTCAPNHQLKLEYGDIKKMLEYDKDGSRAVPTIRDVSNAIIKIRQSKLPDPNIIGNAGSFFKNPEIPIAQFENLKTLFPNLVGYPSQNGLTVKLAAGWLIEQAGWKGKKYGGVGVHAQQALVLVNYGKGKSSEVVELSKQIQTSVFDKFGVALETEVNFV